MTPNMTPNVARISYLNNFDIKNVFDNLVFLNGVFYLLRGLENHCFMPKSNEDKLWMRPSAHA